MRRMTPEGQAPQPRDRRAEWGKNEEQEGEYAVRILRGQTYSILGLDEGVVDGDNLNVGVLDGVAEDDATDATEAVDSDLGDHCEGF